MLGCALPSLLSLGAPECVLVEQLLAVGGHSRQASGQKLVPILGRIPYRGRSEKLFARSAGELACYKASSRRLRLWSHEDSRGTVAARCSDFPGRAGKGTRLRLRSEGRGKPAVPS